MAILFFFFFSSRRRHTRFDCDWSSDVCSSDLALGAEGRPGGQHVGRAGGNVIREPRAVRCVDRKSTRLNSSHSQISYAVFCLKKKNPFTANVTGTTPTSAPAPDGPCRLHSHST